MKEDTKDIAKLILLSLGALVMLAAVAVAPDLSVLIKEINKRKKFNNWRVREALKRLESQELVTISENKNGEITVKFTKKGKARYLKYKLEEMQIPKPENWDGKWRIVIFDIPNNKKQARDALRRKLKELRFCQLQKSVFVHPYDCKNEIAFIKEIYEINRYVSLIEASYIDNQNKLKRIYGLL